MSVRAPQPAIAPPVEIESGDRAVFLDTSGSTRLPVLMEMVAGLSRATGPQQVLREFVTGFRRMFGPQGYVSLSTRGLAPGEYKITRMMAGTALDKMIEADPWRDWAQIPVSRGGLLGRIVVTAYPAVIHHLSLRGDPVVGDALAKYGSLMAIPLFDGGEPLNWSITLREDPEGFSIKELEESILRSNLGGATVKNVMITRQLREAHEEIRREMDQIAKIQRALLPKELPRIPGIGVDVSYQTFDQVGGDMYAVRPLRRLATGNGEARFDLLGPWGILVADVSGHGPAAAVVMAMMQSIIDTYPREPRGPAEVLAYANRHLCAKRIESRFVTAFFAIYDPTTRRFTYSRAGHNPPVWMRPGAGGWDMARLDANGGVPLGILDDATYGETTIVLEPRQSLVLYTDGVTESTSPQGAMFGVEGIETALTECTGEPRCAISHITESLLAHEGGRRPSDDQTLVVMRVE